MKKLSSELENIGLDEKESRVYAALLELGSSTALAIARHTGVKRPTVYYCIDVLKKKGLVYEEMLGLKKRFAPAHPDQFDAIIDDQKRKFASLLPRLTALYHLRGDSSLIKYFEGVQGAIGMHELTLKELQSGDPYYVIAHNPNWDNLAPGWIDDFVTRRAKRKLDTRILYPDSAFARRAKETAAAYNQKVKIVTSMPTESVVVICPQRYVTHGFESPIRGVSIENKSIVETQLGIFRMLWDALPEN